MPFTVRFCLLHHVVKCSVLITVLMRSSIDMLLFDADDVMCDVVCAEHERRRVDDRVPAGATTPQRDRARPADARRRERHPCLRHAGHGARRRRRARQHQRAELCELSGRACGSLCCMKLVCRCTDCRLTCIELIVYWY